MKAVAFFLGKHVIMMNDSINTGKKFINGIFSGVLTSLILRPRWPGTGVGIFYERGK
jgi:hypothetical protein